jgi:SAM-dependent methyltransferase
LSNKNIYDTDFEDELGKFDLIVLKDVIEHIHDQPRLMREMKRLLKPNGHIFFGFPPWQMPFGGHQQIAPQKILSTLPYYHLLPMPLYVGFLKAFGANKKLVDDLVEIKETGISLERFERIAKQTGYKTVNKTLFLFNPIYKYKFGLTPRKQSKILGAIPWIRNFYTTCGYYLLTPKNE